MFTNIYSVAISAVVSGMIIYYGNIALRNILRATAGQQLGQVLAKEERAKLAKVRVWICIVIFSPCLQAHAYLLIPFQYIRISISHVFIIFFR